MNQELPPHELPPATARWYADVTRYQWTVLAIASAGWVFDVFEGQLFGACMNDALKVLLESDRQPYRETYINLGLGSFLAGGAFGGVVFGMAADRWGRKGTMSLTILVYSIFTGLTALAQSVEQLIVLRFLVGMGVGGEWAVAAALVAEVFPPRARPAASGIFHASSVLGTYLAVAALVLVGTLTERYPDNGWRFGFLLGIVPAILILWVRASMREPETWRAASAQARDRTGERLGRFTDLFATAKLASHTLVATGLAIIGLATFWGAHFRGRDVTREASLRQQLGSDPLQATQSVSMLSLLAPPSGAGPLLATTTASPQVHALRADRTAANHFAALGWFLLTTGGGLGLLAFAPISQRIGRRAAFVIFHVGGLLLTAAVCLLADALAALLILLPIFGFFTLGMHAGYAVYFPELYPTRLRSTGAGFCFNMARIVVVPVLLLFAWLQDGIGLSLPQAMLVLSSLFLVGAAFALIGPETRGQPLPD